MPRIEQVSFSGGEISPALYGRTDVDKYGSSVAFMRNWFVHVHGGASTRAGFEHIGFASDVNAKAARLIPFQFNTEQNYILVFGDLQLRIISEGQFLLNPDVSIVSITQANPCVVEVTGHGFVDGDEVFFKNMVGMDELDGRLLKISNSTANTFELADVDSTNYTAFTSGDLGSLYQIASPYLAEELAEVKYTQSADVMILTHPNHQPQELTRRSGEPNSTWGIETILYGSTLLPPVAVSNAEPVGTLSGAAPKDYGYIVTVIDNNGSESVASNIATGNVQALDITGGLRIRWNEIQGITNANPAVVTMAGHPYITGDEVRFTDVRGMTQINYVEATGNQYTVTKINDDSFSVDVDSTAFGVFDGSQENVITGITNANPAVITLPNHPVETGNLVRITGVTGLTELNDKNWTGVRIDDNTFSLEDNNGTAVDSTAFGTFTASSTGKIVTPTFPPTPLGYCNYGRAAFYNCYKVNSFASRIYGYIGQSESNEFNDYNLGPDMSVTPPTNNNPFFLENEPVETQENNAFCTVYHQQRLWFGGVIQSPQSIFASKSGDFKNFDLSNPVRADDSIEVTLATRQVNEVRHLVSIGTLIALTSGGIWRVDGDADGVITPTAISTKNQGTRGCSNVPPVIIGDTVLFIQNLNGKIRDLAYEFESDKYTGNDLTIYAEHLFYGFQIVDWCFVEEPYSMVWCVRSDGKLLSLAYLKEQNVWGWSQHDTDGFFESVSTVAEGNENILYAVVRREVNGVTKRFVERLRERRFDDIADAFCVDSGLTYRGAATNRFIGLDHLEGTQVVALADGQAVDPITVVNGEITLPYEASTIHVGLPYTCQIQTLEIAIDGDDTLRTKKKAIPRIGMLVRDARGLAVGQSFDRLYEIKERNASFDYGAIPSFTGERIYMADVNWGTEGGRFCIEQKYPLPATILSLIPELTT